MSCFTSCLESASCSDHAQLTMQIRNLKLSGMPEHLYTRLVEAQQSIPSHTDSLSMILTDELETRTSRKITRMRRSAGLGTDETREAFDSAWNAGINQKLIRSLGTCRFHTNDNAILDVSRVSVVP